MNAQVAFQKIAEETWSRLLSLKAKMDKLQETYQPLFTETDESLKVEYNLINGEIDVALDKRLRSLIETSPRRPFSVFFEAIIPDWKWYAQGVDLTTMRRDMCFERVWLAPMEIT